MSEELTRTYLLNALGAPKPQWYALQIRRLDHMTFLSCERVPFPGVARSVEPEEERSCRAYAAGV